VKCDICDKVIGNPRGLWLHKIFHHKEIGDAWICEKCPKRKCHAFHTKVAYDKHMREVHDKIKLIK
jgi:protein-arginine kinase activator protein McsA